jgi:Domain of unknown function (DUF5668)
MADSKQRSQAVFGVVLVVVGGILLLDRLDWPLSWQVSLHRAWPLVLIAVGLVQAFRRQGGFLLILVGVIMFMHTYGYVSVARTWPLFIVGGGLSMILEGARTSKREVR